MSIIHDFQQAERERERGKAESVAELRRAVADRARREGVDERQMLDDLGKLEAEHRSAAYIAADDPGRKAGLRRAAELEQRAADDLRLLRDKVESMRDGARERAIEKLLASDGHMPPAEFEKFIRSVTRTANLDHLDRDLADQEQRHRATAESITVVHEPGPYEAGSPQSWITDIVACSGPSISNLPAAERLRRHGRDVADEIRKGTAYGQRAQKMALDASRTEDPRVHERRAGEEVRSLGTGGGATVSASGGSASFVPPAILLEAWAPFRSPYAAFANQCDRSIALPAYGLEVYVPTMSAGTSVLTQTEAAAVAEADPTTTFTTSPVVLKAGQITVGQQVRDRVGPGITGDQMMWQMLESQLAAQIDTYAINQALAGAQTVTNAGATFVMTTASGVGGFLGDLKHGKSKLTDTAGVRLRGSHAFMADDLVDWIQAYADAQGRPMFTPTFDADRLPIRSTGDQTAQGYSGYVLSGLAVFADSNIPNLGTTNQLQVLVARPDTIIVLAGEVIPYAYDQGVAGNLEAIVGVRQYVACVPRYPSGVAAISGAFYAASQFA